MARNQSLQGSGVNENQMVEFKTSIFYDPDTNAPGERQMQTIAKTLASFMNANGGILFIGVSDDGEPIGLASDMWLLAERTSSVVARSIRATDDGFTYHDDFDSYERKLRHIVRTYLSPNASVLIDTISSQRIGCRDICKIEVRACGVGDIVYYYRFREKFRTEVEEVYVRQGNQKRKLEGKERDDFIRRRVEKQLDMIVRKVLSGLPKEQVAQFTSAVQRTRAAFPATGTPCVEASGDKKTTQQDGKSDKSESMSTQQELFYQGSLFNLSYDVGSGKMNLVSNIDGKDHAGK